ncbi:phosphoglycerate mutase family protein [Phlyctema vagabunda]|uniref:Phosphoglycerate mutase family protein n=1 Tax=Phlyctema vagabunda TaxID=108571 RepID=A0ABR4PTK8_9HELO
MRLLLIRHGETVDNVAGKYAGITDSALTNHGVLQANRLGAHLAKTHANVCHIFSSDLQRAVKTANAIRLAQDESSRPKEVTELEFLREQDFGFYEGKAFFERSRESNKSGKEAHVEEHTKIPGFKDVESKESMKARLDNFIDIHILNLLDLVATEQTVVVVAHGIILSHLWRCLLYRFPQRNVSVAAGVVSADKPFSLEHLGGWSNTGYLDLEMKPCSRDVTAASSRSTQAPCPISENADTGHGTSTSGVQLPSKILDISLVVKAVNNLEHLKGLKKTRGGIGSLKHDSKQKTVDSFFSKKRKLESP